MGRIFAPQEDFNFDWKYKEFEIRTKTPQHCGVPLLPYVELIKWINPEKTEHIVLAHYKLTSEGGEWCFAGQRPFHELRKTDITPIWKQLWICAELFDDWIEKESGKHD